MVEWHSLSPDCTRSLGTLQSIFSAPNYMIPIWGVCFYDAKRKIFATRHVRVICYLGRSEFSMRLYACFTDIQWIFPLTFSHKRLNDSRTEVNWKGYVIIICRRQIACPNQNCTKCGVQDHLSGLTSLNRNVGMVSCHQLGDSRMPLNWIDRAELLHINQPRSHDWYMWSRVRYICISGMTTFSGLTIYIYIWS